MTEKDPLLGFVDSLTEWVVSPLGLATVPVFVVVLSVVAYRHFMDRKRGAEKWDVADDLLTSALGLTTGAPLLLSYRVLEALQRGEEVQFYLMRVAMIGWIPFILYVLVTYFLMKKMIDTIGRSASIPIGYRLMIKFVIAAVIFSAATAIILHVDKATSMVV